MPSKGPEVLDPSAAPVKLASAGGLKRGNPGGNTQFMIIQSGFRGWRLDAQ
jgi:hypothetical protein